MNLFCLHLFRELPENFFSFGEITGVFYLPILNMQLSHLYTGKVGIYTGVALLVLALLVFLFAIIERKKNNRILQQEEQFLSDTFARITHEIRTPLTVIVGLSKQLSDQKHLSNGNLSIYLNAIERQGKNLSQLVSQLLDIANLQTSDKEVEWKTGNIITFVQMVSETFQVYAKQKDIELFFFSNEPEIETDFVPDWLNKILYNLLYNAVKYSDEGSRINLILEMDRRDRKKMVIKVIDQGRGIEKERLPYIFDLFYKYPQNGTTTGGNGIGLVLVKQLTEALEGTIEVKSEVGKGTMFTIELPLRRNEKQPYPRWTSEKNGMSPVTAIAAGEKVNGLISFEPNEEDPRTTILLAEDNKDIALYIRSLFPLEQYNIIHAGNGEKAWDIANKHIPDIVITDAVMPKKSGIELCREIKASSLLNHIPVIIISAKDRESDLLEGLKSGADCYIRKPFYPEELQLRVENLLETRQLLKEKYCRAVLKDEIAEPGNNKNINIDFLRHVTDIIHREMKNPDFASGKLAQELAISVSQLNKKLNVITGHSSSAYILQVKLSHAKKILNTQNKTIGEVAVECGIYDVNYFSRVFKKYTGITPTQFKRSPQNSVLSNRK
ncbi:ATP-binding protein [Proteiniphilum sp.]|uniref:hybrid sensor histidine kinase/response regulator transcription factor n=1 Tax=Proteiniphilum sp. TaxID=1926877 RepID=UPI002B1E90CF|nr:ATP-binding protein [Proteiniphilum sp.]MEA4917725.1 response regulator [Proteiniphilum sp.]